jgi:hypothetical protein
LFVGSERRLHNSSSSLSRNKEATDFHVPCALETSFNKKRSPLCALRGSSSGKRTSPILEPRRLRNDALARHSNPSLHCSAQHPRRQNLACLDRTRRKPGRRIARQMNWRALAVRTKTASACVASGIGSIRNWTGMRRRSPNDQPLRAEQHRDSKVDGVHRKSRFGRRLGNFHVHKQPTPSVTLTQLHPVLA